jgi:hypothetical protein
MRWPLLFSMTSLATFAPVSSALAREPTSGEKPREDDPAASAVALELPTTRQGHFIGVGVFGVGAMAFDANRGTRAPTLGQGFSLRLGESVTSWLDLSLAFAYSSTYGAPQDSLSFGRFGIQSQWYLHPTWFTQFGFGGTSASGADPENFEQSRARYGATFWSGIGFNIPLSNVHKSGGWMLTPLATIELAPEKTLTTTALWIGLEVSWWSGLARDKLQLPDTEAYEKARLR